LPWDGGLSLSARCPIRALTQNESSLWRS
jgi:hypothetical protein